MNTEFKLPPRVIRNAKPQVEVDDFEIPDFLRSDEPPEAEPDPEPESPVAISAPPAAPLPEEPQAIPKNIAIKSAPDAMFKNALLVTVQKRSWGMKCQVPDALIQTDSEPGSITGQKLKLISPEWWGIQKFDGETTRLIDRFCVTSIFRPGTYICPMRRVEEVDAILTERERIRKDELVPVFLAAYPAQVAAAPSILNSAFDPKDYPAVSIVATRFSMEHYWTNFDSFKPPEQLSGKVLQTEMEKAKARASNLQLLVSQALRAEVSEIVNRLYDNLQLVGPSGRRKRFTESTVDAVNQFISDVDRWGMTGDEELGKELSRLQDLMKGVDVEAVRSDDGLRNSLRDKFTGIKESLESLVVEEPRRAISMNPNI